MEVKHLTGHCVPDLLTDKNTQTQIKAVKSDSVPETLENKDEKTSPAGKAAPAEEAGSTPDLGRNHSVFNLHIFYYKSSYQL